MSLLNDMIGIALSFRDMDKEMNEEFSHRAELARKKYWDACAYPRKTKKRMRKEAKTDYSLYLQLSKPIFEW